MVTSDQIADTEGVHMATLKLLCSVNQSQWILKHAQLAFRGETERTPVTSQCHCRTKWPWLLRSECVCPLMIVWRLIAVKLPRAYRSKLKPLLLFVSRGDRAQGPFSYWSIGSGKVSLLKTQDAGDDGRHSIPMCEVWALKSTDRATTPKVS